MRSDLVFKPAFILFSAFILTGGLAHGLEIGSAWYGPNYLTALTKSATALISLTTAVILWPVIAKAIAIPGSGQMQIINQTPANGKKEAKVVESNLHLHQDELDVVVAQRTKELEEANRKLTHALAEQAQYARHLNENQERLALAVQGANSGIWDWIDVSRDEEWWSPRFYELLGYKEGEIEPTLTQFKKMLHPEDHNRTFELFDAHFEGLAKFDIEYRLKTKSEGYKWFRGLGIIQRDENGIPTRMVGSISDIHRQKLAEESLKQHAIELETARDKAEAGTRAKSEFLANMSHEIRTPMNSILGYSELLEESPLDEEQQIFIKILRKNGRNLLNLINDILDLSKIESGHFQLHKSLFNTEELINSVLDVCSLEAKEKNLDLVYEIEANVPDSLIGDIDRLRQLMMNLVSNAIKFTTKGSVHIRLELDSMIKDKVRLVISVKDTGIGIANHKIEDIFDAFSQADTSDTRMHGGTGLGLAICKHLAEAMNGSIHVTSEVGKGSEFVAHIELEIIPRRGSIRAKESRTITTGIDTFLPDKALNLLLVEDDLANRQLACRFLSKMGHQIDVAINGKEAIKSIDQKSYDIILMDIQMPVMDGIQVTKHIRETIKKDQQPYIIAVTARAMQGEREQFIKAGMDGYLSKPYTRKELSDMISEYATESQ